MWDRIVKGINSIVRIDGIDGLWNFYNSDRIVYDVVIIINIVNIKAKIKYKPSQHLCKT